MKNKIPYTPFKTFVLRTPLLPFNFVENITEENLSNKEKIKEIINQPQINEALFIASPEFYDQLQKWIESKPTNEKESSRIKYTLYKYLSRMATRPTPFGLFAGCGTGIIGEETTVELKKINQHNRHTRLDMLYLCNLASSLAKNEKIKEKLLYFPNTTIYESGDQLRYIEFRYLKNSRTHHLVQVENSEYLETVLKEAKKGLSIQELAKLLISDEISMEESIEFIHLLIENQLLISELDPVVTGEELLTRIMKIIDPVKGIDDIKKSLKEINQKIHNLDKQTGNSPVKYNEIAEDIKKLNTEFELKFLFQADVNLNSEKAIINTEVLNTLQDGLRIMNKLTATIEGNNLEQFKDAFSKRYETRQVPLLKALDMETGIGYPPGNNAFEGDLSPLIDDIILPGNNSEPNQVNWNKRQNILFEKYMEACTEKKSEIEIKEEDLEPFEENWNGFPATFSAMVKMVESPSEKYPYGRLTAEGVGGNTATYLLGRFCHGNKEIHKLVNEITQKEKELYKDAILAEIVHLPESRVGNVIFRPVFREYEIPILTTPAVKRENTITLDDLFISVSGNEIILYSQKLKKRIIPRLSNAHNYSARSIPVYQFLCDLQNQGKKTWIGFNWGGLTHSYTYKPRVVYKNIILSPASWIVKENEIKDFIKLTDKNTLLEKVTAWREKRNIPAKVLLEDGDNVLYTDLNNILSIKTLISLVKKRSNFVIKEFLFNLNNALVKNDEGIYTNELIFTFYKN